LNAPRTAKDALIAEMLGDMGQLHDLMGDLKTIIPAQVAVIEKQFSGVVGQLNQASSDIPKNVEAASKHLRSELTQGIDDLVGVANEVLLKFSAKTNDLKQSIEAVQNIQNVAHKELAVSAKAAVASEIKAAGVTVASQTKTTPTALVLTAVFAFLFGSLFTALLSMLILK
jgi:hypothetical protein